MFFWAGAPPRKSEAGSQKSEAKLTPPKPEAGFRQLKTRKSGLAPQAGPTTSRRKLAGACSAVQAHGGVLSAERQKREPRGGGAAVTAEAHGGVLCSRSGGGTAGKRRCCREAHGACSVLLKPTGACSALSAAPVLAKLYCASCGARRGGTKGPCVAPAAGALGCAQEAPIGPVAAALLAFAAPTKPLILTLNRHERLVFV